MAAQKAASPTRAWNSTARARDKQGAGSDHRRADQGGAEAGRIGSPSSLHNALSSTAIVQRARSGAPPVTKYQEALIRTALEAAGFEFTNGDEPGVKLKAAKARK
jgi:hypothetical protein